MRTMQTYNHPQPRPIFFNDWRIKLNFGRLMPAKESLGRPTGSDRLSGSHRPCVAQIWLTGSTPFATSSKLANVWHISK